MHHCESDHWSQISEFHGNGFWWIGCTQPAWASATYCWCLCCRREKNGFAGSSNEILLARFSSLALSAEGGFFSVFKTKQFFVLIQVTDIMAWRTTCSNLDVVDPSCSWISNNRSFFKQSQLDIYCQLVGPTLRYTNNLLVSSRKVMLYDSHLQVDKLADLASHPPCNGMMHENVCTARTSVSRYAWGGSYCVILSLACSTALCQCCSVACR